MDRRGQTMRWIGRAAAVGNAAAESRTITLNQSSTPLAAGTFLSRILVQT